MGKSRISSEKTRFFQKKLTFSGIFLEISPKMCNFAPESGK